MRNRNILPALGHKADANISKKKSKIVEALLQKEPSQDGAAIVQVGCSRSRFMSFFPTTLFNAFPHQFMGTLWDESTPLEWGAEFGGDVDVQSFSHVFCRMCFDESAKVKAAIDYCLCSRGRFGSSCSASCNQRHNGVACDLCGSHFCVAIPWDSSRQQLIRALSRRFRLHPALRSHLPPRCPGLERRRYALKARKTPHPRTSRRPTRQHSRCLQQVRLLIHGLALRR